MSRSLRFIPKEGALVHVTCRTIQSRFLLRPSPSLNQLVIGVLGRAQRLHQVACHDIVVMSNHWHGLFSVKDANQLARFMEFVDSNLAREVGRLVDWPDKVWARRYHSIVVSNEEMAQVERFRYLLSHGVKEGLVGRVTEWPGVHAIRELLEGKPLKGLWFDRTKEYAARIRGEDFGRLKYATEEVLELSPLPCWEDLTPEQYREQVATQIEDIERTAAAELRKKGLQPLGVPAILRQRPHTRPAKTKKSPAPAFHAATQAMRQLLWTMYSEFVGKFRDAAEQWRTGDRTARFPVGSFPPGLPFVTADSPGPP